MQAFGCQHKETLLLDLGICVACAGVTLFSIHLARADENVAERVAVPSCIQQFYVVLLSS
jgi:hypothetical protein